MELVFDPILLPVPVRDTIWGAPALGRLERRKVAGLGSQGIQSQHVLVRQTSMENSLGPVWMNKLKNEISTGRDRNVRD